MPLGNDFKTDPAPFLMRKICIQDINKKLPIINGNFLKFKIIGWDI